VPTGIPQATPHLVEVLLTRGPLTLVLFSPACRRLPGALRSCLSLPHECIDPVVAHRTSPDEHPGGSLTPGRRRGSRPSSPTGPLEPRSPVSQVAEPERLPHVGHLVKEPPLVPQRTPVDATAVGPGRKLAHVAKRAPQLLSALPTNPVLHRRSTYFHRPHLSRLAACGSHPKRPPRRLSTPLASNTCGALQPAWCSFGPDRVTHWRRQEPDGG